MRGLELVDELYDRFVDTVDEPLRPCARELPHALRLARRPEAKWSDVFGHEVTLLAPVFFAEAMPNVAEDKVNDALLAHAFAIVHAFGVDRIADGQVQEGEALLAVLERVRAARDGAMQRLRSGGALEFARAEATTARATSVERQVLSHKLAVPFDTYESISRWKQAPASPASLALATVAEWSDESRDVVQNTIEDIALGLQMHDDAVDWEDDAGQAGAWAVSLASHLVGESPDPRGCRQMVLDSGVLAELLLRASQHFAGAAIGASALGAGRLSEWCLERSRSLGSLAEVEVRNAGHVVRAHVVERWRLA